MAVKFTAAKRDAAFQTSMSKGCLKLFAALGADDIDLKEIDTLHRVPAREPANKPSSLRSRR